jgi:hypothetical protein
VKTLEYSCYDINRYYFWTAKLEVSHPLVVRSGEDATEHVTSYYVILQNIIEYTFADTKELRIEFFQCDWFDPINDSRVDGFGMVEVKHDSCYLVSNLLLAHQAQQVYYISHPYPSLKIGGLFTKLILKYTLINMMST